MSKVNVDKDEVAKALQLLWKAENDELFKKWLEENQDELDFDYDQYASNYYENLEEPEDFIRFALSRWAYEEE
jgi:hypothetical protein